LAKKLRKGRGLEKEKENSQAGKKKNGLVVSPVSSRKDSNGGQRCKRKKKEKRSE